MPGRFTARPNCWAGVPGKRSQFQADLPLAEYEFTSPLLGFKKSKDGYSGWYAPAVAGRWDFGIQLPESEAAGLRQVKINGLTEPLSNAAQGIRFSGESKPGAPLRWEIS